MAEPFARIPYPFSARDPMRKSAKLLITGGSGFLGRHVVTEFARHGWSNLFAPRRVDYDLTQPAQVAQLFRCHRPRVVVHLAAQVGGIEANRRHPGTFLYKNLMMGANLLEACRRFGCDKVVVIGTICSYPKFTPVPFKEEDFWNGYPEETNAPYGLAKKLVGLQLQTYHQEFGLKGVYLLPVNLYGPGDNFDLTTSHVIPALIRKCVEAKENGSRQVTIWGTGKPTREFLYVADAARAIRLATEKLNTPEPLNIGSGKEISIADLARRIAEKVGFDGELVFDPTRPDGQPRRCLDVSKARRLLDFEAKTSLDEGLEKTIQWYFRHRQTDLVAA
ncbi:MAG: GDP-L-fucose synthase [Gemmatales bacterium]|nr:MAG: GDP-L-fucose synthase [Gemmatales bacterium]